MIDGFVFLHVASLRSTGGRQLNFVFRKPLIAVLKIISVSKLQKKNIYIYIYIYMGSVTLFQRSDADSLFQNHGV